MEKLTIEDMRNVEAAYERGYKHAMEKLGDGALRLRKMVHPLEEHDSVEADLQKWLSADRFGLRAPGVKDNLFRLSDFVSKRLPTPPRDVLVFLHAYIFALEHAHYYKMKALKDRRTRNPLRRLKKP